MDEDELKGPHWAILLIILCLMAIISYFAVASGLIGNITIVPSE
jgi:hypothetical protein